MCVHACACTYNIVSEDAEGDLVRSPTDRQIGVYGEVEDHMQAASYCRTTDPARLGFRQGS